MLAVISVIMGMLLNQFKTSAEGGSTRLEARAIHRETQSQLRLVLRSATQPSEIEPALTWPDLGTADAVLRFHAPADTIDQAVIFTPRTPDYPEFSIQMEPTSRGLVIQRSDLTGPRRILGRGFSSVEFTRDQKRSIKISLVTQDKVRSASGGQKQVEEKSLSRVLLNSSL